MDEPNVIRLGEQYFSLTQRLSFVASTSPNVNAGVHDANPPPSFSFPLTGQQAFRIVAANGTVSDSGGSGKVVLLSMRVNITGTASADIFNIPSNATMGQLLTQAGVGLDLGPQPLIVWNDWLAQGGLIGQVFLSLICGVNNTDAVARQLDLSIAGLVEIYQASTLRGQEALGFKK